MSKLIAILYASLMLFQSLNISFEDVSKFSALFEHATFHEETYGDTFFDFLSEHYGLGSIEYGIDHSEHKDLPFKHDHKTCCHVNTSFIIQNFEFVASYTTFVQIPFVFFYKESTSLFEKSSVFQPPKFA
ncbi:MAG TPA: hypothetical protein VNJ50_00140 [Gelidibacter sp.]|uniref:hypothetical protein n=1 Tax=Gelidibacter sp. TaxID=2018083 RepID=UPI002CCD8515|nr:hypothetical protein [Gelidibacter sp.]HXJ97228.1 hypothetical protein [Gelidibacter sp.]